MSYNGFAVPEPRSGCAKGVCPKPGTDVLPEVDQVDTNQQLSMSLEILDHVDIGLFVSVGITIGIPIGISRDEGSESTFLIP